MQTPAEFNLEKGIIDEESVALAKIKLGECYEEILELVDYYMDIPLDQRKLLAIWIIGTYFHDSFGTYPFLFINAMRGSGKTRLLRIIAHLSKDGYGRVQTGITESVLFRMPKGQTLVLDELENIGGKERGTLREYLNACYKRGGVVQRVKKSKFQGQEEWVTETFEPYKAIAMANIWGMDEVLGDRCVPLILEKSSNSSKTKKAENFEDNPQFIGINRTLSQISVVCVVSLRSRRYIKAWNEYVHQKYTTHTTYNTYTTLTTQREEEEFLDKVKMGEFFLKIDNLNIDGRNLELLFPLLLIARFINDDILTEILKIGKEFMEQKKEDEFSESRDVSLYDFVSKKEQTLTFYPVKDLVHDFKIWLGSDEEWINEKWFGRALKRLNLVIDKKRMASGRFVILNVSKALEKVKMFRGGKYEM